MEKRKVQYATLHQGVFIPGGVGDIGKTFPPNGTKTFKTEMFLTAFGLEVTVLAISNSRLAKPLTFVVPAANIVQAVLETPEGPKLETPAHPLLGKAG